MNREALIDNILINCTIEIFLEKFLSLFPYFDIQTLISFFLCKYAIKKYFNNTKKIEKSLFNLKIKYPNIINFVFF